MHPDPEQYRIPPWPPAQGSPLPYGAAPWNAPRVSTAWPSGPDRPAVATAAAVLGFMTGGLTALFSFFCLTALLLGGGDLTTFVLALGLPCAVGLIRGGLLVLRRESASLLIGSGLTAVVVLLLALVAAAASLDGPGTAVMGVFVVLAAVLPILTVALAATPTVSGWIESLG